MIELQTKKGCVYCEVLRSHLIETNTPFTETENKTGVAPLLYKDGELVFRGLPNFGDLIAFTSKINNEKI